MITRILLLTLLGTLFAPGSSALAQGLTDFEASPEALQARVGQGDWTVVMIWAHDCHVCNAEAYQYVDFHDMNQGSGARVLGLSLDGAGERAQAQAFVERHGLSFPSLLAEPQDVARTYMQLSGRPFVGTPSLLIFDPSGALRVADAGAVPTDLIEDFIRRESANAADGTGG
jgi:peroxiredoxin